MPRASVATGFSKAIDRVGMYHQVVLLDRGGRAVVMQVSVTQARGRLTDPVRRAEGGDEVVLTRHGRAAARPMYDPYDLALNANSMARQRGAAAHQRFFGPVLRPGASEIVSCYECAVTVDNKPPKRRGHT